MVVKEVYDFIVGNEFVYAAFVFFALFFAFRILLFAFERLFIKFASKTETDLDDILIKKSSTPLTIIAFLLSIYFSLENIKFELATSTFVHRLIYTLLILTAGHLTFVVVTNSLSRLFNKMSKKTKSEIGETMGHLFYEVLRITMIIVLALIILQVWGVEIGPLLAGLGIAGLAVALALQPTLSNIFSGISIIMDSSLKVGDVIKIGQNLGTVNKIGLRATRIITFDNEMIIIPNSQIANSEIQNMYQPDKSIRVGVEFGVAYGVDPEYVKRIALEELEKIKLIDKKKDRLVIFSNMGDSSINFKVMFWVDDFSKKIPAHQEAISRIYRRLYKEDIEIPFPQRTVWLRQDSEFKAVKPSDSKFKEVHDKYYPFAGKEYPEEKIEMLEEPKKENKKKNLFEDIGGKFKNFKFKDKKK